MSACVHFLCLFLCPVLSAVTNLDWIGWTRLASSSGMVCSPVVCLALCTSAPLGVLAGIGKLSTADGKAFADPEVLRRLTSSVSCALDEAAAALTRMRAENTLNAGQADKYVSPTPKPPPAPPVTISYQLMSRTLSRDIALLHNCEPYLCSPVTVAVIVAVWLFSAVV